jgi:hypothetical protein
LPLGDPGHPDHCGVVSCTATIEATPALDSRSEGGVFIVTTEREGPCRNETTTPTPRARPSSRRAR